LHSKARATGGSSTSARKKDQVEGLPDDAPHTGTLVTLDVARNRIYLFQDGQLVDKESRSHRLGKSAEEGR
jgi:hypothetical protein